MCKTIGFIEFRTPTASGGNQSGPNCVEVGEFFTAQASGAAGHCVEVAFTKAKMSNPSGNCVEVGFTSASASGAAGHCVQVAHAKASATVPNGACVEPGQAVADPEHTDCTPETCRTPGISVGDIVVRDSKNNGEGCPVVVFRAEEWAVLVKRVVARDDADHFDAAPGTPWFITDPRTDVVLRYTDAEWDAFRDGCDKGEFDYAPAETAVPA